MSEQQETSKQGKFQAYTREVDHAEIIDLSQMGCLLKTPKPLQINHLYLFYVHAEAEDVFLQGEVVRCDLMNTDDGHGHAVYHNGVEFLIHRSRAEVGLMHLIRDNTRGEKRLGGSRIPMVDAVTVAVGRPDICDVYDISTDGFSVEVETLPAGEEKWPILLVCDDFCAPFTCRIVEASKRIEQENYFCRLEFVDPYPPAVKELEEVLKGSY